MVKINLGVDDLNLRKKNKKRDLNSVYFKNQ